MTYTNASIQQEMIDRMFPNLLTASQFNSVINAVLRDFNRYQPLVTFAKFTTATEQGDYYIFDPNDTQTQVPDPNNPGQFIALATGCLNVENVFWNPGGDWSSLSIFSPGWQMLSQMVLFTGSYFHQPSQMVVLRQELNSWKAQFGDQGFEVFGEEGDPNAFLRIYPLPMQDDGIVIVQFAQAYTLSQIQQSQERHLYQWVEYRLSEAIANYYSQTSGIQLLGFSDSKSAMQYWERKTNEKKELCYAVQGGSQGAVDRSY